MEVGDRVRVERFNHPPKIGTVVEILKETSFPYEVHLDNGSFLRCAKFELIPIKE